MKASRAVSLVFLIVLSLCLVNTLHVKSQSSEAIYIRADGSVEGTDKIQRDGNIYTFTDNINGSIVVEKDGVTIDGAGYILQGTGNGRGVDLYDDISNIIVKNIQIRNFRFGIHLSNSSYTTIDANYIANNFEGIRLAGGFNNTIIGNTIANSNDNGIGVFFNTHHNLISRNKITNNWVGVLFQLYSADNTLSENVIDANNGIGIWLDGGSNNRIIRNNVTDNTKGIFITVTKNSLAYHNNFVNNTFHVDIYGNDPVISTWDNGVEGNYWDDFTGIDNDGDGIGDTPYVIDANNTDRYPLIKPAAIPPIVTPEFADIAESTIYIRADGSVEGTDKIQRDGDVYTFISDVSGSIVVERSGVLLDGAGYRLQGDGNQNGITLGDTNNNTIKNLKLTRFNIGIVVMGSDHNIILENTITDNFRGLDLTASENNTVSGNYIVNNNDGIALENVYNDIVENTITNNTNIGIFLYGAGYNNIIENNITNNGRGILVSICYSNIIRHNNFVNNTNHVETDDSINIWDNDSEGNYWSGYNGTDADGDGIGDTPYIIDENNQDNYPLMHYWGSPTQQSEPFPTWIVATTVIIAVVGAALLIYFTKVKKTAEKSKKWQSFPKCMYAVFQFLVQNVPRLRIIYNRNRL